METFGERLGGIAAAGLFGVFLLALFSAVPLEVSRERICQQNLGKIATAQSLYAEDHNGKISQAGWWNLGTLPYLPEAPSRLSCPLASRDNRSQHGGYRDLVFGNRRFSSIRRKESFGKKYKIDPFDQSRDAILKCTVHGRNGFKSDQTSRYRGQVLTVYLDGEVKYASPVPCWDIDHLRAMPYRWLAPSGLPTACDEGDEKIVEP
ncbi:hypothetical protein EON81_12495 [bacterium]|nr:MAG: hypothetical protein EON81_12495 [bacterium]